MKKRSKMAALVIVRRTAAENLSIKVTYPTAVALDGKLLDYLYRDNDPRMILIKNMEDVTRHLYFAVLLSLHQRTHFRLTRKRTALVMEQVQFTATRPQALALVWFLRAFNQSEFIELKAALLRAL